VAYNHEELKAIAIKIGVRLIAQPPYLAAMLVINQQTTIYYIFGILN